MCIPFKLFPNPNSVNKNSIKQVMNNPSIVKVNNIWAEDLFKWFYQHVGDSGGDGAAAIVCENYRECSEWFLDWFQENVKHPEGMTFWHPKDETPGTINYHDNNENFIFTNDINSNLSSGEYVFIVEGNCQFAFDKSHDPNPRRIIPVKKV